MSAPQDSATGPSEQAILAVLRAAPNPMMLVRYRDGLILQFNDRCTEIFGVTAEQTVGQKARDYFVDRAHLDQVPGLIEKDGRFDDLEVLLRIDPGDEIWTLCAGRIVDHFGENCLLIGLTEITERKKTEATLAREEALSETIRENMDQSILVADADGTITAHNRRFAEFYEVPESALAEGTTYQNFMRTISDRGEFGSMSAPAFAGQAQRHQHGRCRSQRRRLQRTLP